MGLQQIKPVAIILLLVAGHASGFAETTSMTYDALGRVTSVSRSGGPSSGVQAAYTYDAADNRASVVVTGAWTSTSAQFVVVPLNSSFIFIQAPSGS